MKKKFLEAGKIVNTHGVKGEVKIQPWTTGPDFLCSFEYIYIDHNPVKILNIGLHKGLVIASLENINDFESAIRLKNKIVYIDRNDAVLENDEHFLQDLIDLEAFDYDTGEKLGKIIDIITLPSNNVYVISGTREILVPGVPDFIKEINTEKGLISIRLIEGM